MAYIEESIEVGAPVGAVYNQWIQFEEFPQFMEGVKEVRQLDDRHLRWKAEIAGKEEEWDAEITQQVPDQRIGWRSTQGTINAGSVTFYPMEGGTTKIVLRLEYSPSGLAENIGDMIGVVTRRIDGDLHRFKDFIEARHAETGAWRGEIKDRRVA